MRPTQAHPKRMNSMYPFTKGKAGSDGSVEDSGATESLEESAKGE